MLTYSFFTIYQFSQKNPSLAQFIPGIYNKIIIKILGYFRGVTQSTLELMARFTVQYGEFSNYENFPDSRRDACKIKLCMHVVCKCTCRIM